MCRIDASVFDADGNPVDFIAKYQVMHAAMLLDHGSIYIAFCSIAGFEGFTPYRGWVMKYRASDLAFQNAFCTSKDGREGRAGIWQGGGGLASDPDGNVYFLTVFLETFFLTSRLVEVYKLHNILRMFSHVPQEPGYDYP